MKDVKELTLHDARKMADQHVVIKDHDCYFAHLGGRFENSVLVFKDDRHIHYADDFQLHHNHIVRKEGLSALRDFYLKSLNQKLFSDEELEQECSTYDEYQRKDCFLRNYWIMRYDYRTAFYIEKKDREAIEKAKEEYPYFNAISFCYMREPEPIALQRKYMDFLKKSMNRFLKDPEIFRKMVRTELENYEAAFSYRYEDALAALGLEYRKLPVWQKIVVNEELEKQVTRAAF